MALFDNKEDALKYIDDSKLKNPIKVSFGSDQIFKQKSLLCNAESARVEEYGEPEYILNPTL